MLILDDRILTRRYGPFLRQSLPPAPLTKGIWADLRRGLEEFYGRTPRLSHYETNCIGMSIGVFYAVLVGLAFTSFQAQNWSARETADLGFWWAVIGTLLGIAGLGAFFGTWSTPVPRKTDASPWGPPILRRFLPEPGRRSPGRGRRLFLIPPPKRKT